MVYGLRIRDASGNIVVDYTDRLTRVVGTFATGTSDGETYYDPQGGGLWIVALHSFLDVYNGNAPVVTISGGTISWKFDPLVQPSARESITFLVGLY